jgi:hypothetical protein
MLKAEDSLIELQLEEEMAVRTVDKTFLQGQSAELLPLFPSISRKIDSLPSKSP